MKRLLSVSLVLALLFTACTGAFAIAADNSGKDGKIINALAKGNVKEETVLDALTDWLNLPKEAQKDLKLLGEISDVLNVKPLEIAHKLGNRTLYKGLYGLDVLALQVLLKSFGYDLGSSGFCGDGVDGVYGDATAESVKKMQKLLGVEETGVVEETTYAALNERLKKTGLVVNTEGK